MSGLKRDERWRAITGSTYERARLYHGRCPAATANDADRERSPGGDETILLVEDDPTVRQLFATALTRVGYRVFEAHNGREALSVFEQAGNTIDLVLTDMRMPYMGGAELAEHLRSRRQRLKLLAISGYSGPLDPDLTHDFLAKPFSRDDLLKKVREVLDRT